ncbi:MULTISPECIES: hypothetical protein [Halococcus]|uniref:Uncharacterized protein n=1 Tax=Halococcus saccharolyticus DSM 5350 TaxID=1227455 RepID=M0ME10_9EURY|nr:MULTISPECIES: hypothetical protein [Halococcus]EMA43543.1 hypothetical protein C449_13317 [Halococcus saccharolyticus DSM 5350]
MSSEVERDAERVNEEMIADASLWIRIYEDGEAVGVVNIDRQIADYRGASERVSRTLDRMEEEGLTYRGPVPQEEQPENEWRTMTTNYERSGEGLGQYLLREIERARNDGLDISGEPIGFVPEDE